MIANACLTIAGICATAIMLAFVLSRAPEVLVISIGLSAIAIACLVIATIAEFLL